MLDAKRLAPLFFGIAVATVGLCLIAASQATARVAAAEANWPPKARDIVNVSSGSFAPPHSDGYVGFAGRSSYALLTVPADRWLVITDIDESFANSDGLGSHYLELVAELDNAQWVAKAVAGPYHSSVGIAVPPGTKLAWRDSTSLSTDGTVSLKFDLTGYLAAP
jgi:hypothetical protein